MKSIIIKSLFVVFILGVSIYNRDGRVTQNNSLKELMMTAIAGGEDVTVTCSGGSYGQCYKLVEGWCETVGCAWGECAYTGYQIDNCTQSQEYDDCGGCYHDV